VLISRSLCGQALILPLDRPLYCHSTSKRSIGYSGFVFIISNFTELFLYSYDVDFIQGLLEKKRKEASQIRYKDNVLSLSHCWSHLFHWVWNKGCHKDTARSASYLDIHLEFNSEGRL